MQSHERSDGFLRASINNVLRVAGTGDRYTYLVSKLLFGELWRERGPLREFGVESCWFGDLWFGDMWRDWGPLRIWCRTLLVWRCVENHERSDWRILYEVDFFRAGVNNVLQTH